jgi:hypothetical protein
MGAHTRAGGNTSIVTVDSEEKQIAQPGAVNPLWSGGGFGADPIWIGPWKMASRDQFPGVKVLPDIAIADGTRPQQERQNNHQASENTVMFAVLLYETIITQSFHGDFSYDSDR